MDTTIEYNNARKKAGFFDAWQRGKIEVVGPDAADFLHNLSTNDIRNLTVGAGCETFFTNAKAKVIGFCCVYHSPGNDDLNSFWLDSDPGTGEGIIQHLNKYLISEQVEIVDRAKEFTQFVVVGPGAKQILTRILGNEVEELNDLQCRSVPGLKASNCQVRFHRRLGIDCYELLFPVSESSSLRELLASKGAMAIGPETMEVLRIEAGLPVYGIDIDENVMAPEVGRPAISYNKGCYLGQETIVRVRDLGHVNRMLRGLRFMDAKELPRGTKVFREGKEMGEVTSSVVSPRVGSIALAYLNRSCFEPGTRVEVAVGTDRLGTEVSSLPFGQSGKT
jgi:folate-binding protein YgfZ